jgi:hypothetical protein
MADKTPVRVVFDSSNVATGLAEFQSGESVGTAFGGTGLTSIGSAGQVLKVNAAGNGLVFGAEGDISITNLVAPTNADLTMTTSGTGGIILNDITISDNGISTNRSNDDFKINASGTGTVVLENLKIGTSGATVTTILDEDGFDSDSATSLATQQSIKAYVDTQITAEDLDFQADSGGALSIDLDSETITFTGGTGIDTSGSGNTVTFAIDSTVSTLAGSQALTNKTIDVDNNTVSNIEVDNLKSGVLDTDITSVSGSDDTLASAKAIKTYVDSQVTAQDLDFATDDSTALSIDLDSEVLQVSGGANIATSGSANTITIALDTALTGLSSVTSTAIVTNNISSSDSTAVRIDDALNVDGALDVGAGFTISNGTSITAILDEDAMGSNSATSLATQQSVKAYVDTQDANIASDTLTFTNKTIDANGTGNNISNLDIGNMTAASVVLESEGISSNDNDTTLPTSAAVKDYADTKAVLSGSTNNNVATVTGAHALVGEGNLTFDGSTLAVTGAATISTTLAVTGASTLDGVTITDNTVSANASNSALQLASSGTGDIDLNAGADVNIPANIGLTFGDDGEKIEGDGTNLTISSSGTTTFDSAGNIIIDTGGGDVTWNKNGTSWGLFKESSGDAVFEVKTNDKDFIIKGEDGGSSITALTLDMSAAGAATFNDKIVLGTNKEIQFVDTNESIKSDGSKMIIKSGGTTFNLPTADGTAGQALVTDGSGTLSFDSVATIVSDDGLATVKSNKHLGSTARTLDSINATFIDSAFYFFVLNDIVNEKISAEMFVVTNNNTASFLGNRRGIESSGGDNVPTLATDISNGQYRVRVTGTSADCRGSFYKVAMSSSTTDATRGNTVTSSNTDVDSASESVDTFAHATFRGAKYFISVDNDSKTEMEVVEALVVHDGTNAFISQYGHTTSGNNSLVTLTAAISGDNVVVSAAGLETNLNLTMHKILLKDNMTAQSNANQKAFAAVTVSSSATAIDLMDIDEANGAVHFIVGANSSEEAYSIQEVYTAATPGVPAVANGPFVSTKGTRQLEFTAAFDTSSENSLELFASSTSGGSTTVSGYRISALAG